MLKLIINSAKPIFSLVFNIIFFWFYYKIYIVYIIDQIQQFFNLKCIFFLILKNIKNAMQSNTNSIIENKANHKI
jgi:hypothetical protein